MNSIFITIRDTLLEELVKAGLGSSGIAGIARWLFSRKYSNKPKIEVNSGITSVNPIGSDKKPRYAWDKHYSVINNSEDIAYNITAHISSTTLLQIHHTKRFCSLKEKNNLQAHQEVEFYFTFIRTEGPPKNKAASRNRSKDSLRKKGNEIKRLKLDSMGFKLRQPITSEFLFYLEYRNKHDKAFYVVCKELDGKLEQHITTKKPEFPAVDFHSNT